MRGRSFWCYYLGNRFVWANLRQWRRGGLRVRIYVIRCSGTVYQVYFAVLYEIIYHNFMPYTRLGSMCWHASIVNKD